MSQPENTTEANTDVLMAVPPRRPIIVLFILVLLAMFAPVAAVVGDGIVKIMGVAGVIAVVVATLLLPFMPRRFGFRIYDVLAILILLILATVSAPYIFRDAAPVAAKAEEQALALAEALRQYAQQNGTETLPAFFAAQLGYAGMEFEPLNDNEYIYKVHTQDYHYTLSIGRTHDTAPAEFTLTALAAPDAAMNSFFMDRSGTITFFSTQVIP